MPRVITCGLAWLSGEVQTVKFCKKRQILQSLNAARVHLPFAGETISLGKWRSIFQFQQCSDLGTNKWQCFRNVQILEQTNVNISAMFKLICVRVRCKQSNQTWPLFCQHLVDIFIDISSISALSTRVPEQTNLAIILPIFCWHFVDILPTF